MFCNSLCRFLKFQSMARSKKAAGVSRHIRISSIQAPLMGSPLGTRSTIPTTRVLGPTAIAREEAERQKRFVLDSAGLSRPMLKLLQELRGDESAVAEAPSQGREGIPATGTDAHRVHGTADAQWGIRRYQDQRTWRQRTQRLHSNWDSLMEPLANAYLVWKCPSPSLVPMIVPTISPPDVDSLDAAENYDFTIDVLDIYSLAKEVTIHRSMHLTAAEALVAAGYLGCSPTQPSLAISLGTLERFRQTQLCEASFSLGAYAKVICELYMIPFQRKYRTALTKAFDVYLSIRRYIDQRTAETQG
ncbi:hypothetical protein BD779DRAFT_509247 [Infundibulicybe gibba]|nr:hypothetical protein BD779DRAFT_509247 [Infundibulicybe gibba]